jgi:membrane fusion protein (multidrug efflux system)
LLVLVALSATALSKIKGTEADNNKSGKAKVMRLAGIVVQPETFDNILSLSGSIEANEQVEIRSEVSGLESINFQEEVTLVKGNYF